MTEAKLEEPNKAMLLYKGQGDDSEWSLYTWGYRASLAKVTEFGHESFLTHACHLAMSKDVSEVYIFPDTHKACWRCQAPLPDGLKALWILHNGVI